MSIFGELCMSIEETNIEFDDMILIRTKAWIETYDAQNRDRVGEAVTTTQRKRGDNFGYLHRGTGSYYSQWRPFNGKGMVSYPVVKRAVQSKMATSVSTEIGIKIESIRKLPEKEAAAEMCESVYNYCKPLLWTKKHESMLAEFGATSRFCFILNYYNRQGGMIVEIPEKAEKPVKQGITEYTCANCGFSYSPEELGIPDIADETASIDQKQLPPADEFESETDDYDADEADDVLQAEVVDDISHQQQLPVCPDCQAPALQLTSQAEYNNAQVLTGNYKKVDVGKPECQIISPLLIRIDSYKCQGFEYKNAGWFNFHPLIPIYELINWIPDLADKIQAGNRPRWSESARWHYELNNSLDNASGYFRYDYPLDELVEPNIFWISPNACNGWRSPSRYDKNGVTIEEGESLEEAFIRQDGEFKGCCVLVWDEEVYIIGNQNFTAKWNGFAWRIDAQSFYPQGEEGLNKLNDAATNVLSMVYAHVQRMSNPKLIANPLMFDKQQVGSNQTGQIVWLKETLAENKDRDWRQGIGYLQPTDLSTAVYQLIKLIIDIAKEESGVFDEMVGNSQQQETLGGREMMLNQGLGLMTPIQQSKGLTMIESVYQWLEMFQADAPDEAFTLLKGTFEEEWKPQDIEAFRKLDIRREIFISVVPGSDKPRTQGEMEQRFMVAVNMGLFAEPNQLPLDIRSHIVKSVLGIDYDIGNYHASRRVAARRYTAMKREIAGLEPNDAFTIQMDINNIPQRVLRPEIVASLAQSPDTMLYQTDDHLTFISYYTDQLNGLIGAKEPDEVLIAVINKQIDGHRAILAASNVQAQNAAAMANTPPQITQGGQPAAV